MRLRKPLTALSRLIPWMKRVDWVGRGEDIATVAKAAWRAGKWLVLGVATFGTWIVSSAEAALLVFIGVGLVIVLFGPVITEEWIERRIAKAREQKRLDATRKAEDRRLDGWGDILPDMKRLAASLQAERLDRTGEDTVLLNRNRLKLAGIAQRLDERKIPRPGLWPQHGETREWETFLWGFVQRVSDGQAVTIPTLHADVRKALEQHREAWDIDDLLRRYLEERKSE